MTSFVDLIGRLHPLLVHLPIGILLIAFLFEMLALTRRHSPLQAAIPLILLWGAISAALSCLSGWLLSRAGGYEPGLLGRHQWAGIAVTAVAFVACWLKYKQFNQGVGIAAALLLPTVLLAGHWGITLTQGEGYLSAVPPETASVAGSETQNAGLPAVTVSEPAADAIETLRAGGVAVLPVGRDQSFLSVNFVNAAAVSGRQRQALERLQENIVWLRFSGVPLNDSTLALLAGMKNLTRLHLDHTGIDDRALRYLQQSGHLAYLNLVGTKVTVAGVEALSGLPGLQKLFLYQTGVHPADLAVLSARLPGVKIDTGGYLVPVLTTDTTVVAPEKK